MALDAGLLSDAELLNRKIRLSLILDDRSAEHCSRLAEDTRRKFEELNAVRDEMRRRLPAK